jgi:hypothetical protein
MELQQLDGQCGMLLLTGLASESPDALLDAIADEMVEVDDDTCGCDKCEGHDDPVASFHSFGNVLWTDVVGTKKKPTPGERLANYIKAKKLGTVTVSQVLKNAGNKNEFRTFIFVPNKKFLKAYSE